MDSPQCQTPPLIAPPVIVTAPKQRAPTLYAIVIFKLLKASLLLLAAGVFFSMVGVDLQQQFNDMLREANLDPEGKLFGEIGRWLQTVTPANMRVFGTGTILYSAFSLIEGTGLWFRASWAGWMAIGESAFFVPIEIYELVERFSNGASLTAGLRVTISLTVILLLNIAIVWYLYANRQRLFRH